MAFDREDGDIDFDYRAIRGIGLNDREEINIRGESKIIGEKRSAKEGRNLQGCGCEREGFWCFCSSICSSMASRIVGGSIQV